MGEAVYSFRPWEQQAAISQANFGLSHAIENWRSEDWSMEAIADMLLGELVLSRVLEMQHPSVDFSWVRDFTQGELDGLPEGPGFIIEGSPVFVYGALDENIDGDLMTSTPCIAPESECVVLVSIDCDRSGGVVLGVEFLNGSNPSGCSGDGVPETSVGLIHPELSSLASLETGVAKLKSSGSETESEVARLKTPGKLERPSMLSQPSCSSQTGGF